jgi:hypothetical protein
MTMEHAYDQPRNRRGKFLKFEEGPGVLRALSERRASPDERQPLRLRFTGLRRVCDLARGARAAGGLR